MGAGTELALQAGKGIVDATLGMGIGFINDQRQLNQQKRLQDIQIKGSKELSDYNYQKQLEMWKSTNYPAQVGMLKEAGLNPALMYGMGGGGGTTTGSGGGGMPTGGSAPSGGGEIMQMGLLRAQIENIKADTEKKKAEAAYTGGTQTELGKTQISGILQEMKESEQKTKLLGIETNLKTIEENFQTDGYAASLAKLKYETDIALQNLNIAKNDAIISDNTWSLAIQKYQAEAAGILLQNELTNAKTAETKQNIAKVVQDMQSQLKQLEQADKALSQEDEHIIIQKARNELIRLGIWVGAGSQVLGDAVGLMKTPVTKTYNTYNTIKK